MNRFNRIARATLVGGAIVASASARIAPLAAIAQPPAPQHVLTRGAPDAARTLPARTLHEHVFYGRIDAIRGGILTIRTRAGKAQRVDANEAIRGGAYSAPLYLGKIVVVTAAYGTGQTLHASSIMRMGSLDAGTPADR